MALGFPALELRNLTLKQFWLWLLSALLCAVLSAPVRAQDARAAAPAEAPVPQPLFWADGITQVEELDKYKAMGLNTVVVRLTWTPSDNGTLFANDLAPQQNFAKEAAERGLNVIYALPPAPTGQEHTTRISPNSDSYVALWTVWIQGAMASLKDSPNLIGWMLPDDPRSLKLYDDQSFGDWLEANFANVQAIDKQWHQDFHSIDEITLESIPKMVEDWQGFGAITNDMDMDEVYARLKMRDKKVENTGWAFHPASLALAQYRWDTYKRLLTMWTEVVKASDPKHLVFSGRLPDYAQLLALPDGIDVSMPDLAPGRAESDIVTHNPQSIDIARRAGKFRVLPMLSPEGAPGLPPDAVPDLLPRWMQEACARGATGLGFASWDALVGDGDLSKAVTDTLRHLNDEPYAALWNREPVNTTAILLTPLADGATLQYGSPPYQARRGLYGFGTDFVNGEPSDLIWELRWGTPYGGVDYLTTDDLKTAPLDRYSTILLPQALSVSNESAARLGSYAANGGILVADLGLGAVQNGFQVNGMSPTLALIFGLSPPFEVTNMAFNLNGFQPHRLFPSWAKPIMTRPGLVMTAGDGADSAAFDGPIAYTPAMPNGTILAVGPQFMRPFRNTPLTWRAPLSIHEVGNGAAVFAPFRLWTHWRPGHFGFDTFHGDLFNRGVLAAVVKVNSLVPLPRPMADGSTMFPEILNHTSGLVLANHSAPEQPIMKSVVQTSGTGDWLWGGGIVSLPNSNDNPIAGGRPAPVAAQNELESRSRPVLLYTALKPGNFEFLSMRPVALQNLGGGPVIAKIVEERPQSLKVNVWPNSPDVMDRGEEWQPIVQDPATVRLTVVSSQDGYSCPAGSQHRVTITDYAKGPDKKGKFASEQRVVAASADGRLTIEFSGSACAVEIAPYSSATITLEKKK